MSKDLVQQTPSDLISQAVASGADLDKLEKLLTLQERWEKNEAEKAFYKAMAEFKANPPKIDKDKKVAYKEVRYSHASLGHVCEKVSKELSKNGLSASWTTNQNGQIVVTCVITHVLGHSISTSLSAPSDSTGSKNSIQAIGSTISYLQRYTLLSLLGLATYDQDDDGASATVMISDDQLIHLRGLIGEKNLSEPKLCAYLKVESLEKLPATKYNVALSAIKVAKNGKTS